MLDIKRKPKMGLFLLAPERFTKLGEGTARGSYLERKRCEAEWMVESCKTIADVTFTGVTYNADDVRRAIDAFVGAKVDYVLAIYLSWAEDFHWIRFLRDMPPCPILFMHRMRDRIELGDTHDDDEFAEYLCCGGLVGSLEASGSATRFNRPMMARAIGTWDDVIRRAKTFGNAARARALLKDGTFGLLASYNEVMWSTYVDPYSVFQQLGPELRFLSIAELTEYISAVSVEEATAVKNEIASKYEVLPNVDDVKFLASVRATMGMERMAEAYNLDLLVLNDIDTMMFKYVGLRPGFWPTPACKGTMVVPEGDVGSGVACYLLKLLTGSQVNYIEPFHIDKPTDTFEGGHAGPNDYTDPRGRCKISSDVRFAKTKWKYAGAPFAWYTFPAGEKTMLHCSQQTGRFQLVSTRVEALPTEHHLATYSHSRFRPIGESCEELFGKLLNIGVTQHYGIVDGDCQAALRDFAMMMNFEYTEV